MTFWKRMGQAAYMPIKKLKLSSKNLITKFITNMNGPTRGHRGHIQKSLRVWQKRCIYVYFIGKVVWSFFFQRNSSDLLCSHYEEESCLLGLLTSVHCRFFSFLLPRETYPPTRGKSQKWATLLPIGYSRKGDGRNGSLYVAIYKLTVVAAMLGKKTLHAIRALLHESYCLSWLRGDFSFI